MNCRNLERVKMSNQVEKIVGNFNECNKLVEIDVEGNPNFTFEDGILFNKAKTEMQFILASTIKNNTLTIPNTVTSISSGLIDSYATQIKKVIIPASVKNLDFKFFSDNIDTIEISGERFIESEGSIYNKDKTTLYYVYKQGETLAKNIGSMTIDNDTIKTIGQFALYNCGKLTELKIGKNVTNISYSWVWNKMCKELTTVTIDSKNNNYTAEKIVGGTAIYNKNKTTLIGGIGKIEQFTVPEIVRTIEKQAFYSQTKLTNVTILNGTEEIKKECFLNCSALKEINIPQSVTKIGEDAFRNCSSLAKGRGILIDRKKEENIPPDPKNNSWGAGAGDRVVHWLKSEQVQ